MTAITAPNYTQIPDVFIDDWMAKLSPAEFKVLMCLCRLLSYKESPSISISKKELVGMTGLSKSLITSALNKLQDNGLINIHKSVNAHVHQVNS